MEKDVSLKTAAHRAIDAENNLHYQIKSALEDVFGDAIISMVHIDVGPTLVRFKVEGKWELPADLRLKPRP